MGAAAQVLLAARRGRHARVHAGVGLGCLPVLPRPGAEQPRAPSPQQRGRSNTSDWRWCGSNTDALGNLRFQVGRFYSPSFDNELKYLDRQDIAEWDTYIEDINWGYTKFDNFGYAVVTIFQSITLEGWSDIMFFCQDGVSVASASIYFVVMVLFGGFFALNLVLAVLEESTHAEKRLLEQRGEEARKKKEEERAPAAARRARGVPVPSSSPR